MKPIQTFTVVPSLPQKLQCLHEIAHNFLWSWDRETIELFRRLDRNLWNETEHNPVSMLGNISQSQLEIIAADESFIAHMERVYNSLNEYMNFPNWYEKIYGKHSQPCVAYFSAEFGITESIPIYSGGLGILAGDYLKSASDLGLPLVGVGLLYQKGYFRQYLNSDGWQQESYPDTDFYNIGIQLVKNEDGSPITIGVEYPTGTIAAQIWRAQVGRITLYLLDTNVPVNRNQEDRDITGQLYVADGEKRIRQEIMLGFGGIRALRKLGIKASVYHMNEGHSAFLALERICGLREEYGLSYVEAKEIVSATNVFTTHTPEPAGIDKFHPDLIKKYLDLNCHNLGISFDELMALGRENPTNANEEFSMAVLAIKLAAYRNGVSKLHGEVSREMWGELWPNLPQDEVPIGSVTNGIHTRSWISNDIEELFDRYVGQWWANDPIKSQIWERIRSIPDDELWRTHERRRERLISFARERIQKQMERRGAAPSEIIEICESLNTQALTIGFARRFAPYKRANLLMNDPKRLAEILGNKERPIQIIYAGKAHPNDSRGKELIREIIHLSRLADFRHKIVFIEDYDMNIARYLVQGCDLWLSTPKKFREASGTSGMKAAMNGVINMSILDGWWYEAYEPEIGWAIGSGEEYDDDDEQNRIESNALYDILEKEVIPLFYERGTSGMPRGWIAKMREIMIAVCSQFNTDRMVNDYITHLYHPCTKQWQVLSANDFSLAKQQSAWKSYLRQNWSSVRIDKVEMKELSEIKVGGQIEIKAQIHLGGLKPEDVSVEIYEGALDPHKRTITNAKSIHMQSTESHGKGDYTFKGTIRCQSSGLHGYSVRVLPRHDDPNMEPEPGLITWAS